MFKKMMESEPRYTTIINWMQMLLLRELEKGETFASLLNIHTGDIHVVPTHLVFPLFRQGKKSWSKSTGQKCSSPPRPTESGGSDTLLESEPRYTTIINCIRLPILYSAEYRDVLEMVYEMFVFKQQKIIINQRRVSDPY
jgi:hypothetical protein